MPFGVRRPGFGVERDGERRMGDTAPDGFEYEVDDDEYEGVGSPCVGVV